MAYSANTPAQLAGNLAENEPFINTTGGRPFGITMNSASVDSANTPTTQLRRGLVVGFDSATGAYFNASNAAVDAHVKASVDSAEAPDGDWEATTLTVALTGIGALTHVMGSNTTVTNLATAIADINADPALAPYIIASDNGSGLLRITAVQDGVDIEVSSSLSTAYGGVTVSGSATLTTYGILMDPVVSMRGINDDLVDRRAQAYIGRVVAKEDRLFDLTLAAKTYFEKAGIILA